jgi:hypothetical protein
LLDRFPHRPKNIKAFTKEPQSSEPVCNFDGHNGDVSQDCEPAGSPSGRLRLPDPIVPQVGLSVFFCAPTRATKWLELLKEIAPQVKWIAYIFRPKASPYAHLQYEAIGAAAGISPFRLA